MSKIAITERKSGTAHKITEIVLENLISDHSWKVINSHEWHFPSILSLFSFNIENLYIAISFVLIIVL